MTAVGNGAAARRVMVVRPGDELPDPVLAGEGGPADVAVVLVRQLEPSGPLAERLQRISQVAGTVVVLIAGRPARDTTSPALAAVRAAADVVAHVGDDEQALDDVVSAPRAVGR